MSCTNCTKPITDGTTLVSTCATGNIWIFMSILEFFIRQQCELEDPCGRISPRNEPEKRFKV